MDETDQTEVNGPFAKQALTIPYQGEVRLNAYPPKAAAYKWSNGWQTPTIFVAKGGWYWVEALVDGQWLRDSIRLRDSVPCFLIPDAISVNSEADPCIRLGARCGLDSLSFCLYDRFGKLMYKTDVPVECWEPLSGDNALPEGFYVYILVYQQSGKPIAKRNRTLTIIR